MQHRIWWTRWICSYSFSLASDMNRREVRKPELIHVYFVSQRYLGTRGLHPALDLMVLSARRWDILTDAHSKPDLLQSWGHTFSAQHRSLESLSKENSHKNGACSTWKHEKPGENLCSGMQIAFWDLCLKRKSLCGIWPRARPSLWLSKWKTSFHQSGGNTDNIKLYSVLGVRIFLINTCRGGECCFYVIAASVKSNRDNHLDPIVHVKMWNDRNKTPVSGLSKYLYWYGNRQEDSRGRAGYRNCDQPWKSTSKSC